MLVAGALCLPACVHGTGLPCREPTTQPYGQCTPCCCWLLLPQVCNDVQIMKYETQCQQVQQMKTKCDIVMNQQCNKVGHTSLNQSVGCSCSCLYLRSSKECRAL